MKTFKQILSELDDQYDGGGNDEVPTGPNALYTHHPRVIANLFGSNGRHTFFYTAHKSREASEAAEEQEHNQRLIPGEPIQMAVVTSNSPIHTEQGDEELEHSHPIGTYEHVDSYDDPENHTLIHHFHHTIRQKK